jgi:hypothetical protein
MSLLVTQRESCSKFDGAIKEFSNDVQESLLHNKDQIVNEATKRKFDFVKNTVVAAFKKNVLPIAKTTQEREQACKEASNKTLTSLKGLLPPGLAKMGFQLVKSTLAKELNKVCNIAVNGQ